MKKRESVITDAFVSICAGVLDGAVVPFLGVLLVLLMDAPWVVPVGKTIVCQIHLEKKENNL